MALLVSAGVALDADRPARGRGRARVVHRPARRHRRRCRGWRWRHGKPVVPVSTLEALAYAARLGPDRRLGSIVAVDRCPARQVFAALYEAGGTRADRRADIAAAGRDARRAAGAHRSGASLRFLGDGAVRYAPDDRRPAREPRRDPSGGADARRHHRPDRRGRARPRRSARTRSRRFTSAGRTPSSRGTAARHGRADTVDSIASGSSGRRRRPRRGRRRWRRRPSPTRGRARCWRRSSRHRRRARLRAARRRASASPRSARAGYSPTSCTSTPSPSAPTCGGRGSDDVLMQSVLADGRRDGVTPRDTGGPPVERRGARAVSGARFRGQRRAAALLHAARGRCLDPVAEDGRDGRFAGPAAVLEGTWVLCYRAPMSVIR